ncbi:MAG TPA: S24 family peptidase [Thermoanaerobaculia bacterium]|nr:S24 family peptidase [Thermoanaerobaculia bacterium]
MDAALERLVSAVENSGYKKSHIAADAGMGATKLSKILKGRQTVTLADFCAIARAIGQDPARFFTDAEVVVELTALREIHEASRAVGSASNRLATMLEAMLPPHPTEVPALRKEPRDRSAQPVRAAANPNAEMVVELEKERKRIPRNAWNRGARIIVRVVGDLMNGGRNPLRDGDLAYLKPTRSRRNVVNRVALVRREDGLYLKTFEMSGHTIRLVSANPQATPRVMEIDARAESIEVYGYFVDSGR